MCSHGTIRRNMMPAVDLITIIITSVFGSVVMVLILTPELKENGNLPDGGCVIGVLKKWRNEHVCT